MKTRDHQKVCTCPYCGKEKAYPDAFGSVTLVKCWDCIWQEHWREGHKRWWRKNVTKPAKRAAKQRYQRTETSRLIDAALTETAAKGVAREVES